MEMFRDISVGEFKYRVNRMTARNGSWIVAQIATKMLPSGMEGQLGIVGAALSGRSEMSEAEFHNIQDHCLRVVSRHGAGVEDKVIFEPILQPNGVFTFKELEHDGPTVMKLTVGALIFNVVPFFSEGVLGMLESQVRAIFPDLIQSNTPS